MSYQTPDGKWHYSGSTQTYASEGAANYYGPTDSNPGSTNSTYHSVTVDPITGVETSGYGTYVKPDQNTNNTCKYLITQNNFIILQEVQNFRNGTYGTTGQFGSIDLITLVIIILSMIGLNRINESVGLVFSIAIIGACAWFGFIEWPSVIIAGIALTALYTYTTTRKD